jgi:hypothetical protein
MISQTTWRACVRPRPATARSGNTTDIACGVVPFGYGTGILAPPPGTGG